MKIDKRRFLLLTSAIATTATVAIVSTTACNTVQTDTDTTNNPRLDGGDPDGAGYDDDADTDGGPTCLGDRGAAPVCEPPDDGEMDGGADAGDGGAAVSAKCPYECTSASQLFKSEVATAISGCIDKAVPDPTVEGACDEALTPCVDEVLGNACDDETAAEYCTTTLKNCDDAGKTPTQTECVAAVKARSGQGKTALTQCTQDTACEECFAQAVAGPLPVE
jgi:hypothetical protein